MDYKFKIWRQEGRKAKGKFVTYELKNISQDSSFLEAMDILNEQLVEKGEDIIAIMSDCREGICGACGVFINGRAHGPLTGTTTCQLHMRHFGKETTVVVEPWRAKAFPIVKDLVVDRTAFDEIQQAGGYISINTGAAQDANAAPIAKAIADEAFNSAACIGCGACVATCKNAAAMLFTGARVSQFALLPQGHPEREIRVQKMIKAMDKAGFGFCTNTGACEVECPKEISLFNIARLHREFYRSAIASQTDAM